MLLRSRTSSLHHRQRAYIEKDILRMKIRILSALKFDLGRPLPLHFLRRASKAVGVDAATHTLAK